jgi:serine/threonine protein phosphatase PrpC
VVASDGLWDVMTADEAVSHVMDSLACGKNAAGAAQALVEHAVALGLTTGEQDNTTALVVSFVTAEQTAGASA